MQAPVQDAKGKVQAKKLKACARTHPRQRARVTIAGAKGLLERGGEAREGKGDAREVSGGERSVKREGRGWRETDLVRPRARLGVCDADTDGAGNRAKTCKRVEESQRPDRRRKTSPSAGRTDEHGRLEGERGEGRHERRAHDPSAPLPDKLVREDAAAPHVVDREEPNALRARRRTRSALRLDDCTIERSAARTMRAHSWICSKEKLASAEAGSRKESERLEDAHARP